MYILISFKSSLLWERPGFCPALQRCFADLNRARAAYRRGLECNFEWEVPVMLTSGTFEKWMALHQQRGHFLVQKIVKVSKTIQFKGEEEIECNLEQHASPIGHRWSTWVQNVPGLGCRITLPSCSKRSLLAFLKGWALPRGAGSSCWFGGAIASAGTGAVECAKWDSEPWVY
jgi:hypothetical protein